MKNLITGTPPTWEKQKSPFCCGKPIWDPMVPPTKKHSVVPGPFVPILVIVVCNVAWYSWSNKTKARAKTTEQHNTYNISFSFSLCTCMNICICVIATRYKFVLVSVASQHAITENQFPITVRPRPLLHFWLIGFPYLLYRHTTTQKHLNVLFLAMCAPTWIHIWTNFVVVASRMFDHNGAAASGVQPMDTCEH